MEEERVMFHVEHVYRGAPTWLYILVSTLVMAYTIYWVRKL